MNDITFVIFTYNEEKRIERVIQNLKDYGKILLNDDHSTDRTHEIALSYGCDILLRVKNYGFVENQEMVNSVYDNVTTEWLYWGFADEMLEKETLLQIQSIIQSNEHDIINIDRKNYFYGEFCHNLYHARTNKIFKKHAIDFRDNVIHGMGKPTVSKDRIYIMPDKYFVHHFISNTAQSYINVMNIYIETELLSDYVPKESVLYFLYEILKAVIKNFYIGKGFKARFSGLALTELMIFYFTIKNIKHFEKNNRLNKQAIEDKNDNYRDTILTSFK
jgi:glycosyltransferase involved in cell wall biosynthesis